MFRIGQKVARIPGSPPAQAHVVAPPVNAPVTISNIYTIWGELLLEFVEYPAPDTPEVFAGFLARYFRPVIEKKTDISVFEEILKRETVDDRAPAHSG